MRDMYHMSYEESRCVTSAAQPQQYFFSTPSFKFAVLGDQRSAPNRSKLGYRRERHVSIHRRHTTIEEEQYGEAAV